MNKQTKALLNENNRLEKRLNEETNNILTDIVVYIRSANITEYNQEILRRDITNMLIEGQERGQSTEEVIGDDYKAFCDAAISEMPQMTKRERTADIVKTFCLALAILIICWFAFSRMTDDISETALTAGDIASAAIIIAVAFGTVIAVTKNVFDAKETSNWKLWLICTLVIFACIAPSIMFRRVVAYVPTAAAALTVLVLLAVYKILDR